MTTCAPILRCERCSAPSWQVLGPNQAAARCDVCPGILRRLDELTGPAPRAALTTDPSEGEPRGE